MPQINIANIVYDVPDTEMALRVTKGGADLTTIAADGTITGAKFRFPTPGAIQLRLLSARLAALGNIAAIGGLLATDTAPSIGARNGATDPGIRISWASSHSEVIVLEGEVPDDADITVAASLKLLLSYAGATNTAAVAAAVFVGVGGSNIGGSTSVLTASVVEYSIPLTLPAGAPGSQVVATLTPGAHTTDILRLDNARITYTRR